MRFLSAILLAAVFTPSAALSQPPRKLALAPSPRMVERAQPIRKSEADFVKEKPAVGDMLPDLTVYSPEGAEVKLSRLRGQYVVLTFGCLT